GARPSSSASRDRRAQDPGARPRGCSRRPRHQATGDPREMTGTALSRAIGNRRLAIAVFTIATPLLVAASDSPLEPGEDRPGGDTTIDETGRNAFSIAAPNLTEDQKTAFVIGNSFFKKNWVEAPSSTEARDGLGPHFIARSCGGCHTEDGRGSPPESK